MDRKHFKKAIDELLTAFINSNKDNIHSYCFATGLDNYSMQLNNLKTKAYITLVFDYNKIYITYVDKQNKEYNIDCTIDLCGYNIAISFLSNCLVYFRKNY